MTIKKLIALMPGTTKTPTAPQSNVISLAEGTGHPRPAGQQAVPDRAAPHQQVVADALVSALTDISAASMRSPRRLVLSARFDGQLRLVDASREFCNLMRMPLTAMLGKHFKELCTVYRSFTQACSSPGYIMEFEYAEVVLLDSCNASIYANMTSVWMRTIDGVLESVNAFVTDFPSPGSQRGERAITAADSLAGLLNSDGIRNELNRVMHSSGKAQSSFLLLVSLDDFRTVSETFGHDSGITVLIEVAERVQWLARKFGTVGRYRTDELLVVCDASEAHALGLAQDLLDTLSDGFMVDEEEIYLTASIGVCRCCDAQHGEALIAAAEAALRHAKKSGGNRYVRYSSQIGRAAKYKADLERSLRKAVSRGELELEYQPRVDLRTMKVVALEALIRWNHPTYGRIPPLEFIPIAEEKGLIVEIGKWVLETACMKARDLLGALPQPIRVSVNVSAHQLKDGNFYECVRTALRLARLPPDLLELELTESALVDDFDHCAAILRDLKDLGLLLSVDDFGTGYSSLAYLQLFPFDTIKLDKTFINNKNASVDNRKLVRALIDLSHALDLAVVAEGVECEDTLAFLSECHCDEVQGYLLSRPLGADALDDFLGAQSGRRDIGKSA